MAMPDAPSFRAEPCDETHRITHSSLLRTSTIEQAQVRTDWLIWLFFVLVGLLLSVDHLHRLAQLDANGISLATSKPLTWDFTNLWYGGRLALDGRTDELFDLADYRQGLRALFVPYMEDSEWSYPPVLLLIGAPLALLPLYGAYALWTVGTLGLLSLLLRRAGLPLLGCALLWITPGALNNVLFGQNGALTAFLLLGGLLCAERRPMLAGLFLASLLIKPHLGLLVPVCLIAAGTWRTIAWTALFAFAIAALTTLCFGPSVWFGFVETTQPLMQSIMEAPYGQGYQVNAATMFVSARWLGLDIGAAYAVQALTTLIAGIAAWKLWRGPTSDPLLRAAATTPLVLLATPYGYSYDMVMVSAAVLIALQRGNLKHSIALIPVWLWPVLVHDFNAQVAPLSPLVLIYAARIFIHAHGCSRGGDAAQAKGAGSGSGVQRDAISAA